MSNLGRSTDKWSWNLCNTSLPYSFHALSFRKPIYLFDDNRLGDPFVVVGSLQRYKRKFAGHRMLTPQSTPSSDAFENSWLSNPNKDTKRTRSLYSTPFGGFRCQLPGCRTCSNWHWKLIWPVSHVIPRLPSKLWIVLRVIPATNKTAIETEKDKGTFSFQTPSFYRILIIISNALDRTNSITLRNCKIRAASCGKTYCFRPRQGKSEICERVWKSPSTKEVLNRVNRQPSNGLNLNQQPSIMQIKINHKKVVRYFKSRDFN